MYDAIVGRLVLVHGSVTNGAMTWGAQRPLADRWELVVLDRPGFPPGPAVARVDFELDAAWLAEHCSSPAIHLLRALLRRRGGAARRGGVTALGSLTVIEPPATRAAVGVPAADEFGAGAERIWQEGPARPGSSSCAGSSGPSGCDLGPADAAAAAARPGCGGAPRRARPVGGRNPRRGDIGSSRSRSSWSPAPTTTPSTRSATRSSETSMRSASSSPVPATPSSARRASTRALVDFLERAAR